MIGHTSRQFLALEDVVIQLNLEDSYLNLTLKSIAMLKWIHIFCNNARFIAKVDDDFLVSMDTLLNVLVEADKQQLNNTILGQTNLFRKWNASGHAGSIWNIDSSVYPLDTWPNYVDGHFYIITNDVIDRLLQRACKLDTPLINIEDIFLTGIVRVLENVTLTTLRMFGRCSGSYLRENSTVLGVHHYDYITKGCMQSHRKYE